MKNKTYHPSRFVMRMKSVCGKCLSVILFPFLKAHRWVVMKKRPVALREAEDIVESINNILGCPIAQKKKIRLEHLCQHYLIDFAELGITSFEDLEIRVNASTERARHSAERLLAWAREKPGTPIPPKKDHPAAIPILKLPA